MTSDFALPCAVLSEATPVATLRLVDRTDQRPTGRYDTTGALDSEIDREFNDDRLRHPDRWALTFEDYQLQLWELKAGGRFRARYPRFGLAFEIVQESEKWSVVCQATPDCDWVPWVPLFAQGAVTAAVIALSGRAAFHANTMSVGGSGILIAGPSGAGKTLTSALLALAGHGLVAEDVSVVDPGSNVLPGLLELRVRTDQDPLGQVLTDTVADHRHATRRTTPDGRTALRLPDGPLTDGIEPSRVLLPIVDPVATRPRLETLRGMEIITALRPSLRLVGWVEPNRIAADFGHCADLAQRTLVQRLVIPTLSAAKTRSLFDLAEQLDALIGSRTK